LALVDFSIDRSREELLLADIHNRKQNCLSGLNLEKDITCVKQALTHREENVV